MKKDELRAVQAPLKEKYRSDPQAAMVTLHAKAEMSEEISCKVETGKALVEAGLHPATGGDGLHACSGDMLLEALAACAGVTLQAVASALGIKLSHFVIRVEGDLDVRGTLAVSKDAPVGFQKIRLLFDLDTNAEEGRLGKLIELTERYCVVLQTLMTLPTISVSYSRNSDLLE